LLLEAFGCGDLLPYPVEGEDESRLQDAEAEQVRRQIAHMFDSMIVVEERNPRVFCVTGL
ncbi:hypothetical protein AB0K74_43960, partial [Streptomyces sp. NPDC056159]|uniref:hypothetical protein n=1 Tax=Streptomyces sp. NPDC056159 TaxID=3155537 RepID=UPI0034148DCE